MATGGTTRSNASSARVTADRIRMADTSTMTLGARQGFALRAIPRRGSKRMEKRHDMDELTVVALPSLPGPHSVRFVEPRCASPRAGARLVHVDAVSRELRIARLPRDGSR